MPKKREKESMLVSLRIVDQGLLCRIDLISVYLCIAYSILNKIFLHQTSSQLTLFMVAISFLSYMAKRREKVAYAAAAHAMVSVAVAYWLHHRLDLSYHSLYILIPLVVFMAVLLLEWQTSWITGLFIGHWVLIMYLSYKVGGLVGFEQFDGILSNMPLLLLAGLLVLLFSRMTNYAYNGEWVEKLDFALILLGIGYAWSVWNQPGQPIMLAVLYMGFTVFTAYAKQESNKWTAPVAYALFALVVCLKLQMALGINNLYLILLLPMAAFGLSLVFSLKTHVMTGFAVGYWIAALSINLRAEAEGPVDQLHQLFSYENAMQAMGGLWWMLVLGVMIGNPGWFKSVRSFRPFKITSR